MFAVAAKVQTSVFLLLCFAMLEDSHTRILLFSRLIKSTYLYIPADAGS